MFRVAWEFASVKFRIRIKTKVAPLSPCEPYNGSPSTLGSQEVGSILQGEEENPDWRRPRGQDATANGKGKQPELKAKKIPIRRRIDKFFGIFSRRKVVPWNGLPEREHPSQGSPKSDRSPNPKLGNGGHAPHIDNGSENTNRDAGVLSTPRTSAKNCEELGSTLGNECIHVENAGSSEQKVEINLLEKLDSFQPSCKKLHEEKQKTFSGQTSLIRSGSSTAKTCLKKQGIGLASVSPVVKKDFSPTTIQEKPAKSAEGAGRMSTASRGTTDITSFKIAPSQLTTRVTSPRWVMRDPRSNSQAPSSVALHQDTTQEATPTHRDILDVKPDVLAAEMQTFSLRAKQRRIQEITAYIKRRIDLQTLRDLTSNTSVYTSDERKEIEENGKRAETLLNQLKIVVEETNKRKQRKSRTSHHKQQHLSMSGHVSRTKFNLSRNTGRSVQNLATQVATVTPSCAPQPALPATPKVPSGKSAISTSQPPTKPSKSKTPSPCPAINRKTFLKSIQKQGSPAQPKATSSKDLQALGLPIIDEKDVQPVETKKGTPIKLGIGNYGGVYLMRSHLDGTLMAVKRLTQVGGCQSQDKRTQEMLREIRAMEAVKSCRVFPKFLGVLDLYSFGQEFVGNSRTMKSWSALKLLYKNSKGPRLLPLDWVRICIDVTEGLDTLHRAGWTHNDLHFGNIMVWRDPKKLTATWEGKIIDLGKASRIKSPPPPMILTFVQMMFAFKNCTQLAPEIVEGRSRYNVKSDIYSLGIVLQDIAKENRLLSGFKTIGDRCVFEEPNRRPELKTILKELNQLREKFVNPKRVAKTKSTR